MSSEGSGESIFSLDISTSQEKMAVVIIPVVIATWEAILLHTLETQRETRVWSGYKLFTKWQMDLADDNVYPYATFSSLLNSGSLIDSVLDSNRAQCSAGPDLGTNYLQSILSDSLGPVVNILTIFSNANILKKKTSKVSVVRYWFRLILTKKWKNKEEEKMIRLEPRLISCQMALSAKGWENFRFTMWSALPGTAGVWSPVWKRIYGQKRFALMFLSRKKFSAFNT